MTPTPDGPAPPPFLPGRPWPGGAKAETGRLYHFRTGSGHYLVFQLRRARYGSGKAVTYGEALATGYGLTPALPGGQRLHFDGLTPKQLAGYAKSYPPALEATP